MFRFVFQGILLISWLAIALPVSLGSEIKEAYPRYYEEQFFQRISEFFSGEENPGERAIVRTDPQARDGFYFALHLGKQVHLDPETTQIRIEIVVGVEETARSHTFELPANWSSREELFLGFTGAEWPEDNRPLAWKVEALNSASNVLATYNSFLWKHP